MYAVHCGSASADCEISENNSTLDINHEDESYEDEYDNNAIEQYYDYDNGQPTNDWNNQPCISQEMLQKSSATFLLGLKEKYQLTQTSLQGIIQGVTALNHQNMSTLKAQVRISFSVWFSLNLI